MKMEGRGYTDYYRNTSEELFIKTMMESSMGMQAPSPTMEMLGFKNLSQSFRADSEELFKNWLTTSTENNGGIANRTRQASRRISAEFSNLSNQQQSGVLQKKRTEELSLQQGTLMAGESSSEPNQHLAKNPVDKGLQATNLFLAKAWLNSSQPMTRSRSSELRRRYAAMQNTQTSIGIEAMNNMNSSTHASQFDQEYSDLNGFNNVPMSDVSNHMTTFMSPTNSSSSTFNIPQERTANNISSVVNMLKGTLERKKLFNNMDMEAVEDSFYGSEEALGLNQGHGNNPIYDVQSTFQDLSRVQFNETGAMQTTEGSYGYAAAATTKRIQMSTMSREPSQSESSAAATAVSTGFDTCDGPSISGQAHSVSESSRKRMANGRTSENGPRPSKDVGEHMYDNLKDRKKGGLARYGSLTSVTSVEQGDPTKKRRVERSRKMAEAKERNMTPAVSSDMQSLLKRCENLEKEVRSLKLNLSFMNRKDSEQTKQIEEFQKQNEDLGKEKERLLGEIERIVGRM